MIDIRHYSDEELSLNFLNEESLYNELRRAVRRNDFSILVNIADELFIYNDLQLEDLRETFNNEEE